ncbi:hypothetical protein EK904_014260 [Melospiza melodia maxima]|nr:hypothetical protein EK904_014260 [Melospiza melodia maxima]
MKLGKDDERALLITPGRYQGAASAALQGLGLPEGLFYRREPDKRRDFPWTSHHLPAEGRVPRHMVLRNLLSSWSGPPAWLGLTDRWQSFSRGVVLSPPEAWAAECSQAGAGGEELLHPSKLCAVAGQENDQPYSGLMKEFNCGEQKSP